MKVHAMNYRSTPIVSFVLTVEGRDTLISYYEDNNHGTFGAEVYTGRNYVVGSRERSYSRNYKSFDKLPKKFVNAVETLMSCHKLVDWDSLEDKSADVEV